MFQWLILVKKVLVDEYVHHSTCNCQNPYFFAKLQRVLALCYFWDLEKFALAKICISKKSH